MSAFAGKWRFESSENNEAFFQVIGVSPTTAMDMSATLAITINGDHHVIKEEWADGSMTTEYDLGVEFDDIFLDGNTYKSVVRKEGEKLIQEEKGANYCVIERWVEGGNTLVIVCECKGVKSTIKYKRIA